MQSVLLVDASEELHSLSSAIEEAGYEVEEASSGIEGLSKMESSKFDLVVLDFFMPGMSGREVLEKMRDNPATKSTRVVFLTVANFSTSGQDELRKLGCLDYIQKPVDNDDFVRRVASALKK